MLRRILLLSVVALVCLQVPAAAQNKPDQGSAAITGVWKLTEMVAEGAQAERFANPSGLYVFTRGYYSIIRVNAANKRQALKEPADPNKITDAEKIAAFDHWNPVTAQSGTYTVKGSTISFRPLVAKNQSVMDGPTSDVTFQLQNNTLSIAQKTADGKTTRTWKFTRLE